MSASSAATRSARRPALLSHLSGSAPRDAAGWGYMHFYCLGPELGQPAAPGRLEVTSLVVVRLTIALLLPAPRLGILQAPGPERH